MHNTRYAHSEGHTDICYANHDNFITTGEDGDIRIWKNFDDLDSTSIQVGDKCFAIAYSNKKIYVSDDLNEIKSYDYDTNELQGVITSFTLPATCINVNKLNTHLVCGSSDFEIHLVDLNTLKFTSIKEHKAPILSLCFDPLDKYFVSTSCDGTARFWSIQNLNCVKTLTDLHKKSNDFYDSESRGKIAWHKDGVLIAVPCQKEIHFYERETWLLKFKIDVKNECKEDDFCVSMVMFSPDGKFILAATNTQMIYIYSIINKSLVYKYSYTKSNKFCSLAWNPSNQNELMFCDIKGNIGLIKPTFKDTIADSESTSKTTSKSNKNRNIEDEDLEMDDLLNLIDSDEKSNDAKEVKKSKKEKDLKSPDKKRKRVSDEEDDDVGIENMDKIEDDDDDDECISLEKLKAKTIESVKKEIEMTDNFEDDNADVEQDGDENTAVTTKKKEIQIIQTVQSFQPSSTPLALPERFMVWNSVGLITQFNKEGDDSIDIEFHNATYHHTIHIKNQFGYTMGSMSKEAVVLASPGIKSADDDEILPLASIQSSHSKLTCILINSIDNHKEWNIDMPRKESIKCVCACNSFIACATSRKFLRIYCLAGTQKEIICLPGSPIALSCYQNCILVVYGQPNESTIRYSLYFIDDLKKREPEEGIVPMSDNSKLEWIGFSDEGNPYFYDSNGFLYSKCLTVAKEKVWTPLCYLREELKHKSDNYWIVGIAERTQMIKAILCRHSKYPYVLPRPNLSMVSLSMPLNEKDSEKTQLEQEFWKNKYLYLNFKNYDCSTGSLDLDQDDVEERLEKMERTARETLMKMFMLSCKNNREFRAYEIATMMDMQALELALKYATRTRALVLAQNLNVLAEKKAQIESLKEKYQQDIESSLSSTNHFYHSRTDNRDVESIKPIEDSDIIFTKEERPKSTNTQIDSQPIEIDDSFKSTACDSTPTIYHTNIARSNPFAKSSASAKISGTPTAADTTPKSILNEIEEKINKQSAAKEKESWKPTPTRKLVKSKLSNTPINSFFGSKN